MANLTITVDAALLRRGRIRAAEQGTSVNAVLREYLALWAGATDRRAAIDALLARSRHSTSAGSRRKWTRDELHDR